MEDPNTPQKALLVLSDGTVFSGTAVGKKGTSFGEICFNTSMTGYQEMLSDPSSFGQIIVSTNSHTGNYGCKNDERSAVRGSASGFVCRSFSEHHSRYQSDSSLSAFMEANGIVGMSGIDTRALVRRIRDKGTMSAVISSEILDSAVLKDKLKNKDFIDGEEEVNSVSTESSYEVGDVNGLYRIAVVDFGLKQNLLDLLAERGGRIKVFPSAATYEEILEWNPDGILLSGGPGNPNTMKDSIRLASKILEDGRPVFGICLGHQLLALATGLKVEKLTPGDRGSNQPVINLVSGRGEITSQNHGYGVSRKEIEKNNFPVEITHFNLNNETVEGLRWKGKKIFSVQFHPEGFGGPHDSRYLFDDFVSEIKEYKQVKV